MCCSIKMRHRWLASRIPNLKMRGATNQGRQITPGSEITEAGTASQCARQSHGWFFHLGLGATEGNFWNVLIGRHQQNKEGKSKLRNKICICLYRWEGKAAPILLTAFGEAHSSTLRECTLVMVVKKNKQQKKTNIKVARNPASIQLNIYQQ